MSNCPSHAARAGLVACSLYACGLFAAEMQAERVDEHGYAFADAFNKALDDA